jgi:PadR family transcriptional regulator, regulatory protein PadR
MATPPGSVLPGTLELLVLRALATGELHGLGVARRIQQMTKGVFDVKAGSLFPALHRMERAGWLRSVWDETEGRRRARFYELTAAGRRQLESETDHWRRVVGALAHALKGTS